LTILILYPSEINFFRESIITDYMSKDNLEYMTQGFGVHSPAKGLQSLILAAIAGYYPKVPKRGWRLYRKKSAVGQEYPSYQTRFPQGIEEEP
jgi:hypothetical protein